MTDQAKQATDALEIRSKWGAWASPIPGHDGYYASECGHIFSDKSGALKKLKGSTSNGYSMITMTGQDGRQTRYYVHRVVFSTYHAMGCVDMIVRHLDDERSNNQLSNLMAGTPSQNYADRVRNSGHGNEGGHHGMAKLTEDAVLDILANYKPYKAPMRIFAARYGVSEAAIKAVIDGRSWAHVTTNGGAR